VQVIDCTASAELQLIHFVRACARWRGEKKPLSDRNGILHRVGVPYIITTPHLVTIGLGIWGT